VAVEEAKSWNGQNLWPQEELGLIEHEVEIQAAQKCHRRLGVGVVHLEHGNPVQAGRSDDTPRIESAEDSHPQAKNDGREKAQRLENEPINVDGTESLPPTLPALAAAATARVKHRDHILGMPADHALKKGAEQDRLLLEEHGNPRMLTNW
jgi:hypothetical protein